MAICDECCCYDDNHIDGEDITEEELEKDPLYEPHRYYYWHGDIQEDYQMPAGYDCLCERCFGDFLNMGKIIEADDPSWDPETMGWFKPFTTECKQIDWFITQILYNTGIRNLIPFLLWHHLQKESLEES